jgi:very-short-patch-repair endonuclease
MIPRNKSLRNRSTELRNDSTKQENHLWYDFLRKCCMQFYRHRIIGNYIVDFYCPKAKLVIELDGSQHYEKEAAEYDSVRTEYINSLGLQVIRFSNKDIDDNFAAVCQVVEEILSQLLRR